jgi:hypothetical protein
LRGSQSVTTYSSWRSPYSRDASFAMIDEDFNLLAGSDDAMRC